MVRSALLAGRTDAALWISRHGRRLLAKALSETVRRCSGARFGRASGPHAFRHALATTAVLQAPATPTLASDVLSISTAVAENHYNLAGQVSAITAFAGLVDRQRRQAAAADRHPGWLALKAGS